jgi:hypothetical protein
VAGGSVPASLLSGPTSKLSTWITIATTTQPPPPPSHDSDYARLSLFTSWSHSAFAVWVFLLSLVSHLQFLTCGKLCCAFQTAAALWILQHSDYSCERQNSRAGVMAPISIPRAPSGDQIRQVSQSISTSLSSIPSTLQRRDAPDDVYVSIHKNIPFIPRAIQHISNLLSRTSGPISSAITLPKRQNQILAIPTTYAGLNDGPAPGTVAGIVIGAVGGFLLILWLLYTCFSMGGFGGGRGGEVVEEEIVRRRSRSPRRSRSHSETIEITKSRSPQRRERIVVEETRRVSRPPEPEPEDIIDDIVEVIEEHSLSPPPPSRRTSKRTSGYRNVDPAEFGGGGRPMRKVR